MGAVLTDAFALLTQGITFVMEQPLLMVPVSISIGAFIIRVVKSNVRA